jgi:hypothetical protein
MTPYPYCLATAVAEKSLAALIEAGGVGTYRDSHPWIVARELKEAADRAEQTLVLVIASRNPLELTHWTRVRRIEVVELHRGLWETACDFDTLHPISEIWSALDSLLLKPGDDQLRRERLEPIRQHRQLLDVKHLLPYAVCETPAFIGQSLRQAGQQLG